MKTIVSFLFTAVACLFLSACSGGGQPAESWGFRGSIAGRFSAPRGIEVTSEKVFVIDRTGRVQAFNHAGEYLYHWMLEKVDNGTPTALIAGENKTLWIPDTHNSRLLKYSEDGNLLMTFGENGTEPGRFQFVTDVAIGPNGNLFIAEYGFTDRIQVFSPQGEYLNHWGSFGEAEDQFQRPMAIAFDGTDKLYIADSSNHSIKVYTIDGKFSHAFGTHGSMPGELEFPYDLAIDQEGDIYTIEFSNHRIQKWSPNGEPLSVWGAPGSGDQHLSEPWGISLNQTHALVADTLNHRVQVLPLHYFQ